MITETLPRFWQVLLGLRGYEVHRTYSAEECLDKVNEIDGKVDIDLIGLQSKKD
jgi:hypothetical protein